MDEREAVRLGHEDGVGSLEVGHEARVLVGGDVLCPETSALFRGDVVGANLELRASFLKR